MRTAGEFLQSFVKSASENYGNIPLRILGPSPANVMKVSNKYRYKLIIKCRNDSRFRSLLSGVLADFDKKKSGVSVYADMNAVTF